MISALTHTGAQSQPHSQRDDSPQFTEWRLSLTQQIQHKLRRTENASVLASFIDTVVTELYTRITVNELTLLRVPTVTELLAHTDNYYSSIDEWKSPINYHNDRVRALRASLPDSASTHPLLPARPYVLIGRLADTGDAYHRLSLVDDTGRIAVHPINADARFYHRWAIYFHWSLVRPYREPPLAHWPVTERHTGSGRQSMGVPVLEIDARDAVLLPDPLSSLPVTIPPSPKHFLPLPIHLLTSLQLKAVLSASAGGGEVASECGKRARSSSVSRIHVKGTIIAKSPLITVKDKCFIAVELAMQDCGIFLLIQDELARLHHHFLHVDRCYLFTNLKLGSMPLTDSRSFYVLRAQQCKTVVMNRGLYECGEDSTMIFDGSAFELPDYNRSDRHLISSSEPVQKAARVDSGERQQQCVTVSTTKTVAVDPVSFSLVSPSQSNIPVQHSVRNHRSRTIDFEGFITRCVAPGIYELDGNQLPPPLKALHSNNKNPLPRPSQLLLYFTHAPSPYANDGLGLRVGSRVRLWSVHAVYRKRRLMGFGMCGYSSLQILSFSPFGNVMPLWQRHSARSLTVGYAYWRLYRKFNLVDTALMVDLIAQLRAKIRDQAEFIALDFASTGALSLIARECGIDGGFQSDAKTEFFDHSQSCRVADCGVLSQRDVDPALPPLTFLFLTAPVTAACETVRRLSSTLSLTDSEARVACANAHVDSADCLLTSGAMMIACLKSSIIHYQPHNHRLSSGAVLESVMTGLMVCDISSSDRGIDCVVTGDIATIQLNELYYLRSFTLCVEALTPPLPLSQSQSVKVGCYLVIDASNLVPLPSAKPGKPSISVSSRPSSRLSLTMLVTHTRSKSVASVADCCYYLHGTLVNSDSHQAVQVTLKDCTVEYFPLIRVGSVVTLSACRRIDNLYVTDTECQLTFLPSSSLPLTLSLSSLPSLTPITDLLQYTMLDQASSQFQLVSFTGVVVSKEWRQDSIAFRSRHSHSQSQSPTQNKWFVKVRSLTSSDCMDVYVDLKHRKWVGGILSGSVVTFYHCVRRISPSWRISIDCNSHSMMHVQTLSPAISQSQLASVNDRQICLSYFYQQMPVIRQLTFAVRCRLLSLHKASFTVECTNTEHAVSHGSDSDSGSGGSNDRHQSVRIGLNDACRPRYHFSLHCLVDDGTARAIVHCEDAVAWQVLNVSRGHRGELELFTRKYGGWELRDNDDCHPRHVHDPAVSDARSEQQDYLAAIVRASLSTREIRVTLQQIWLSTDIKHFQSRLPLLLASRQSIDHVSVSSHYLTEIDSGENKLTSLRYARPPHFKVLAVESHGDARSEAWRVLESLTSE